MSPVANFRHVQMDQLYLPFLQRLLDMVAALNAENLFFRASEGHRTFAREDELYAQGRTAPGPIVTPAQGGESAHNFGIAVDFMRIVNGKASWVDTDYEALGPTAVEHGLVWGGSWHKPDRPHVQWPGFITAEDMLPLKEIYLAHPEAPLSSVWAFLDGKVAP